MPFYQAMDETNQSGMGVITKLEIQKRSKRRVNIFIDEAYAFSLPIDEAARLSKGQVLTDDAIAALMDDSAVGLAVDRALRLLSLRPRSIREIRDNLARGETAPPVIDRAIERLAALGYVDDAAFAAFWVSDRMRFKPASPRALRYELMQKGVSREVIDAALADLDADDAAYAAASVQARRLRGLSQRAFTDKVTAVLLRRGFTYEQVRRAIRRMIEEFETDDPDFFTPDDAALEQTMDD
jgi:regulatory protein